MAWFFIMLIIVSTATFGADEVAPKFEEFPADIVSGPWADNVKLPRDSEEWRFRTRLEEAFSNGVNFAERYAIADWGCGTNCNVSAIIDIKTGDVTFGPGSQWGFEYQIDSRLFIANPRSEIEDLLKLDGCPDKFDKWTVTLYTSRYYEWTGTEFRHLTDINPCSAELSEFLKDNRDKPQSK